MIAGIDRDALEIDADQRNQPTARVQWRHVSNAQTNHHYIAGLAKSCFDDDGRPNIVSMRTSIICVAALAACLSGCVHAPAAAPPAPQSVTACVAGPPIDLQRYMGKWFVIAETPYLNDNDYVGSYDEWTLRADGRITDDYLGRRQSFDQPVTGSRFVAKVVHGTGNTTWRVRLVWPFEVLVATAYVDPDYHYTIRCMVDSNMVWVLSRSPAIDEATYLDLIARLAGMGFNVERIRQVPQDTGRGGLPQPE